MLIQIKFYCMSYMNKLINAWIMWFAEIQFISLLLIFIWSLQVLAYSKFHNRLQLILGIYFDTDTYFDISSIHLHFTGRMKLSRLLVNTFLCIFHIPSFNRALYIFSQYFVTSNGESIGLISLQIQTSYVPFEISLFILEVYFLSRNSMLLLANCFPTIFFKLLVSIITVI